MKLTFSLMLLILFTGLPFTAAQSSLPGNSELAENCIVKIYDAVSSTDGTAVDWDAVRSYFIEDAVIVLRTSRENVTQFTVDGFIDDFKKFYTSPAVSENGFTEKVIEANSRGYKDMAFVSIVYEANIPNSMRTPQRGIDYWLMEKLDGKWKVIAVTNEVIPPGENPLAVSESASGKICSSDN